MKRFLRFLASIPILIICTAVAESITSGKAGAQFPVLIVDTAVRNRLAEEWEPTNRYQHERGYCVRYSEEYVFSWSGPVVVYELTSVTRAAEENTTGSSIRKMTCPAIPSPWVFLHTHPPTGCTTSDDSSCVLGGPYANQCYPSSVDMGTLNKSDKPFSLIQCDEHAVVPVWRTAPYPPGTSGRASPFLRAGQIVDRRPEEVGVVLEQPKGRIAVRAKQSPDDSTGVAVVNAERFGALAFVAPTNRTGVSLLGTHGKVILATQAVILANVAKARLGFLTLSVHPLYDNQAVVVAPPSLTLIRESTRLTLSNVAVLFCLAEVETSNRLRFRRIGCIAFPCPTIYRNTGVFAICDCSLLEDGPAPFGRQLVVYWIASMTGLAFYVWAFVFMRYLPTRRPKP